MNGGTGASGSLPDEPTTSSALSGRVEEILQRHGPSGEEPLLAAQAVRELAQAGATPVEAVVVVGDLRLSGFVLKEAVQPALFARFIIGFTEAVRGLANASGGWFDKFTGDGFIAFWIPSTPDRPVVGRVSEFCQGVLPAADALIGNLRRNSRNFPVGVGLSLGIDSGPCQLVLVGDALTLVGSPIVGATRMVSCAKAHQALANVYFGSALEQERDRLHEVGIALERTVARTKEYPEGQEAFSLSFSTPRTERTDDS